MTSALREMPIGINAYVRYRGCDFNLLCRYRNEILRVKQLYQNLAACFASNPEDLVWMPIRDLEHVDLSELQKILNPSPPVPAKLYTVPETPTQKTSAKAPTGQRTNAPTPIRNTPTQSAPNRTTQAPPAAVKTSNPTVAVRRVLISQSDPFQTKLWQLVLGSQGVQVILADAAEDLLGQVKKYRPHLLIQDMGVTQFNPYEFCRDCRAKYPQLPILLTHAVNRAIAEGEKRWATSQGAADIIPALKPSVQELIPSLVYVLGRLGLPSPDVETLKRSLRPTGSPRTSPAVPAAQGSRPTAQVAKIPAPPPVRQTQAPTPAPSEPHPPNRPSLMAFMGMLNSEPKPSKPKPTEQDNEQQSSWLKKCWQVLNAPV
jgi:CheY-like chemotaxis protein